MQNTAHCVYKYIPNLTKNEKIDYANQFSEGNQELKKFTVAYVE